MNYLVSDFNKQLYLMNKERTEGQLYFLNYTDNDRAPFIMVTRIFTVHALVNDMSRTGSCSSTLLPTQSERGQWNSET